MSRCVCVGPVAPKCEPSPCQIWRQSAIELAAAARGAYEAAHWHIDEGDHGDYDGARRALQRVLDELGEDLDQWDRVCTLMERAALADE